MNKTILLDAVQCACNRKMIRSAEAGKVYGENMMRYVRKAEFIVKMAS